MLHHCLKVLKNRLFRKAYLLKESGSAFQRIQGEKTATKQKHARETEKAGGGDTMVQEA